MSYVTRILPVAALAIALAPFAAQARTGDVSHTPRAQQVLVSIPGAQVAANNRGRANELATGPAVYTTTDAPVAYAGNAVSEGPLG